MVGKPATAVALAVLLAGCLANAGPTAGETPECAPATAEPRTTTGTSGTATATPASVGTRHSPRGASANGSTTVRSPARFYVVVERLDDPGECRGLREAPPDERLRFEDLAEARREEFLTALREGRTRADAWTTGSWYVAYEGRWYRVTVVVEQ
ncbi:MAG: hypothetical protein ABEI39_02765 [Halobacteriales archaeon]